MDHLLEWSLGHSVRPVHQFCLVIILVVSVAVFRTLFVTSLLPWLFFIPLIVLVGLVLGRGAGLCASVASTIAAAVTLADLDEAFWLTEAQFAGSLLFLAVTLGLAWMSSELRSTFARHRLLVDRHARTNTELRAAEQQHNLLNEELSHRLKNVLAVVQSVVSQTLRQASDLPSANTALSARLVALGNATSVLTANSWASADMTAMIEKVLGPHAEIGHRIKVHGPTLTLNPRGALAFALALHELATNAAKYGALSNERGHVELSWSLDRQPDEPNMRLIWKDINGPPVTPPSRRGFGSTMIERSLKSYFRGETNLEYRPEGLMFEVSCRLADAGIGEG